MLLRFDPFREFDRLAAEAAPRSRPTVMPIDAVRRGDQVEISVDLPGVDASSIELEVERNVLTIEAHRERRAADGEQVLASERAHGSFRRQLFLGETLDAGEISADYRDGVLTVTVAVADTAKPRRIAVNRASAPEVQASATES